MILWLSTLHFKFIKKVSNLKPISYTLMKSMIIHILYFLSHLSCRKDTRVKAEQSSYFVFCFVLYLILLTCMSQTVVSSVSLFYENIELKVENLLWRLRDPEWLSRPKLKGGSSKPTAYHDKFRHKYFRMTSTLTFSVPFPDEERKRA